MNFNFPTTLNEAKKFQENIAQQIILEDEVEKSNYVVGLDISYKKEKAYAAAVVYDSKKKKVIEKKNLETTPNFEYISSFLFMREVPIFLQLVKLLESQIDLFLVDGHGIAHPLYAGSAAIFGYLIKKPVIGIAKNPMNVFQFKNEKKRKNLLIADIHVKNKLVGKRIAYQYKNWKPIFVSPGNKISVSSSLKIVLDLLEQQYKLPKPLMLAHLAANEFRNNKLW